MRKKILVYTWLILLGSVVAVLFWYNEWKFSLPTPVPAGYVPVPNGTFINLPAEMGTKSGKPVFLHFFNPDCPCSKFNIEHVRNLIKTYSDRIDFKIVLVTAKHYTEKEIQKSFD